MTNSETFNLSTNVQPAAEHFCGRLSIDLSAVGRNYQTLAKHAPLAETAAAVKANAYGLGLEQVAGVLADNGCRTFFVALPEEGARLRKLNSTAEIFVLAGIWRQSLDLYVSHRLNPVLNSLEDIALWKGANLGGVLSFALHIDTGMNRLGLALGQAGDVGDLAPDLLMSHFACADQPDHPLNKQQVDAFDKLRAAFPASRASLANSAAILSRNDCHFDLTRPGIALYGGSAAEGYDIMQPVIRLEGRILQIRQVMAGETIGYGATHTFTRASKIAIVGIGYADGYFRAASGSGTPLSAITSGGSGFINGQRVPVVGRLSMDLTAFDISDCPQGSISQGDWIELIGDNIAVDDVATSAGTIDYEILTSLGRRFSRTYVNG